MRPADSRPSRPRAGLPGTPDSSESIDSMGPPAPNGRHSAVRKTSPRRPAAADEPSEVRAPAPLAAPVACAASTPVDVPMWPLQSAAWLQPDVPPSPPAWSGLAVERRHRIPAPDFVSFHTAPLNREHAPKGSAPVFPASSPNLPHGDLAPLGWDPRAVCQKEKGE